MHSVLGRSIRLCDGISRREVLRIGASESPGCGGIRAGLVHGSSDRGGAYPSANPVSPADIAATIYHCLGIDHHGHVHDQQGRPLIIGAGEPILPLVG